MVSIAEQAPLELDLHDFSNTTEQEFWARIERGERFVVYHYAMSIVVYSFRHSTRIHVTTIRKRAILKGLPWTLLTLALGWWAIPIGPVFTLKCLYANLRGGTDVSGNILEHIRHQDPRFLYGLR